MKPCLHCKSLLWDNGTELDGENVLHTVERCRDRLVLAYGVQTERLSVLLTAITNAGHLGESLVYLAGCGGPKNCWICKAVERVKLLPPGCLTQGYPSCVTPLPAGQWDFLLGTDGNQFVAVRPTFIDLQNSLAGFGSSHVEAMAELLRQEDEQRKKEPKLPNEPTPRKLE